MEEEARRAVPWKVISAILLAGVVILAAFSAFQFVTRPEEFVPQCPTNYGWDAGSRSCILSDTFAPSAVSAVDFGTGALGEVFSFDGSGSTDDVGVTEWIWDFGDGTGATGKTVKKAYYVPGAFVISLVVRDAAGNEGTNTASFTRVKVVNPPAPEANGTAPVAFLAVDVDVMEPGDGVFADGNGSWQWRWSVADHAFTTVTGSEDLDLDYDFGDGAAATGSNATHTYTVAGNYALRLTVTGNGTSSFAIHTIHVLAVPEAYVGEIKNPDTFITTTIAEAEHLDPARAYDSASGDALRQVFEPLVMWERDSLTTLKPMLATQVPSVANGLATSDGMSYTFPIRHDVKFHNGDILDAYDVEYSFERVMFYDMVGAPAWLLLEPLAGVGSIKASLEIVTGRLTDAELQPIVDTVKASVEALDQWTVKFTLQNPFPPFLGVLSGYGIFVMNKDFLIDELDQWDIDATDAYDLATIREYNRKHDKYAVHGLPDVSVVVGTGPYTVKSWENDVQIVLERFDDYWQGPATLKTIVVKNVPEWGTRKLMFLNGDTDFVSVPTVFREQVLGAPDVRVISGELALVLVGANFQQIVTTLPDNPDLGSGVLDGDGIPPTFFQDQNIRRAFSWAMDYDTLITEVRQGFGIQPFGPIPKPLLGYTDQGPKYSLNLVKAADEFRASEMWPAVWDTGFKFTLTYNEGNDLRRIIGEILRDNLKAINPKFIMDLRPVPWGLFLDLQDASKLPLYVIGWGADYPDPHNFAVPFMRSGFGTFAGPANYVNATVDGWIDEAGKSLNPARRVELYENIQEANFWDPVCIWAYQSAGDHWERTWVQGYYYNDVTTPYYYNLAKG